MKAQVILENFTKKYATHLKSETGYKAIQYVDAFDLTSADHLETPSNLGAL